MDEKELEFLVRQLQGRVDEMYETVKRVPERELRVAKLEEFTKELSISIRELDHRVSAHDNAFARIEVLIESLKAQWTQLDNDIRGVIRRSERENTHAWKEVTIEAIKTIAYVAGAILAAKLFIK